MNNYYILITPKNEISVVRPNGFDFGYEELKNLLEIKTITHWTAVKIFDGATAYVCHDDCCALLEEYGFEPNFGASAILTNGKYTVGGNILIGVGNDNDDDIVGFSKENAEKLAEEFREVFGVR